MKTDKKEEPRLINCACRNLRMTTRMVTQYYDKALNDSGIKSTQFALLNDIAFKEEGLSINELAEYSMMDQTTVTRNIEILRKNGYVIVQTEEKDSRRKRITLSDEGKEKLNDALPLWKMLKPICNTQLGMSNIKISLRHFHF